MLLKTRNLSSDSNVFLMLSSVSTDFIIIGSTYKCNLKKGGGEKQRKANYRGELGKAKGCIKMTFRTLTRVFF